MNSKRQKPLQYLTIYKAKRISIQYSIRSIRTVQYTRYSIRRYNPKSLYPFLYVTESERNIPESMK
jgi:hypothetical protein